MVEVDAGFGICVDARVISMGSHLRNQAGDFLRHEFRFEKASVAERVERFGRIPFQGVKSGRGLGGADDEGDG